MSIAIANASRTPATLRFTLFDTSGMEHGYYEQILPAHSQRRFTLAELFNHEQFRGVVRLWSDVAIAVSAKRVTRTLRAESVESEIGYVEPASLARVAAHLGRRWGRHRDRADQPNGR